MGDFCPSPGKGIKITPDGQEMAQNNKENGIFREKNIEKVSSPESLNDYIRVTNPSVWIVLIALVVLLAGMLTWSIFGKVRVKDADGNDTYIAPITYVTN